MKHITMADKSLLLGDESADVLVKYAAVLGRTASADSVTLRAIGVDGSEIEATFLLNSGTVLMAETTHSSLPEPDNDDVTRYMRDHISSREDFTLSDDLLTAAEDD